MLINTDLKRTQLDWGEGAWEEGRVMKGILSSHDPENSLINPPKKKRHILLPIRCVAVSNCSVYINYYPRLGITSQSLCTYTPTTLIAYFCKLIN